MAPFIHRFRLLLLVTLAMVSGLTASATPGVDESFAPKFYTYGQLPEMVWNPVSEWLYCRVVAERMNGQNLTTNLLRFTADGEWDDTWTLSHDGDITCIALLDSGQMLIGGDFSQVDGHDTYRVARLNSDGSVDTTFALLSTDLPAPDDTAFIDALAMDDGGNLFVGLFSDDATYAGGIFYCIGPLSSILQPTFGQLSTSSYDSHGIRVFYVQDDAVIIGGSFLTINGVSRPCLARLKFDGTVDTSFNVPLSVGYSTPYYDPKLCVNDIVEATDGNLWIGGCFTSSGRPGIIRISPTGTVLSPSSISIPGSTSYGNGLIRDLAPYGNNVLAVGYVVGSSGGTRDNIQYQIDTSGQIITDVSAGDWSGSIVNINGDIAVGRTVGYLPTTSDGSLQKPIIFADSLGVIKQATSDLYLFSPDTPDLGIVRSGNRPLYYNRYVFGVNDGYGEGLYALNEDGSTDATFQNDFHIDNINGMKALPDGRVLLFGSFYSDAWPASRGILLLDADGTVSRDFTVEESDIINSFYDLICNTLPSGKYLLPLRGTKRINGADASVVVFDFTDLDKKKLAADSLVVEEIYSASYHDFDNTLSYDVSATVQSSLTAGNVVIDVTDAALGVSSTPSSMYLDVSYRTNLGDRNIRIRENGQLVLPNPPWDTGLVSLLTEDRAISVSDAPAVQSDGSIVYISSNKLVRLSPSGVLDALFQPANQFYTFSATNVFVDDSDRIYLFGTFKKNNGDTSERLIRLLSDGNYDASYHCDVNFLTIRGMNLDGEGNFYFSGYVRYDGVSKNYLVRILADGSVDEDITELEYQSLYIAPWPSKYIYANDKRYIFADPIPPEVFVTPSTMQVNEGEDVTFWLGDRGADETYQWMLGGAVLDGQTGPSLTIDPTTLANAGAVSAQVTGPGGTVMRMANLQVNGFDFSQWGAAQGLSPEELADPDSDLNGDGLSLGDEYLLRTDLGGPTTRSWAQAAWDGSTFQLNWEMLPGRRYWVDCSPNLVDWTPVGSYTSDAVEAFTLDLALDPEAPCFYKVRVELIAD